jgi:hypothetical protein
MASLEEINDILAIVQDFITTVDTLTSKDIASGESLVQEILAAFEAVKTSILSRSPPDSSVTSAQ